MPGKLDVISVRRPSEGWSVREALGDVGYGFVLAWGLPVAMLAVGLPVAFLIALVLWLVHGTRVAY
jgi:hypothetical protein